jgi:hypothetical protein
MTEGRDFRMVKISEKVVLSFSPSKVVAVPQQLSMIEEKIH